MTEKKRCAWPGEDSQMLVYHDTEWGVPCRDDLKLFEYIVLDTFQAGLSWRIILHKREGFRKAFKGFDPARVARMSSNELEKLMTDTTIVRNRLKIGATITNAQKFLEVQDEFGSFSKYLWQFVGDKPIVNRWKQDSHIAASSAESDTLSADMKERGFKFVGTTICYAFMQGAGLINDHIVSCFRHTEI